MKTTIREVVDKLESIELTIRDFTHKNPVDCETLDRAEEYLREYYDMLASTKVEI